MKRKAIVAAVEEEWIDCLSLDEIERAHETSCGGGGSCGSSHCGCRVSGRPFRAARPVGLDVKVGDTVEVTAPASRALAASLAVLGLPILMGILSWLAVGGLFPDAPEGVRAASAAAGFVAAAALVTLAGSRKRSERLPEITSVAG